VTASFTDIEPKRHSNHRTRQIKGSNSTLPNKWKCPPFPQRPRRAQALLNTQNARRLRRGHESLVASVLGVPPAAGNASPFAARFFVFNGKANKASTVNEGLNAQF
jgi:hypothetical protein